ncbi:sigma-70 family RNA polymerase sigma factor [Kitasatospora sp. NPDC059571]|uniref:sigma-70 family RNA polymerase sigma factor n=1 Tax=Kitasatospora sp. NPDC059571 TaxID=3346871 RepID=UPI0036A185E9
MSDPLPLAELRRALLPLLAALAVAVPDREELEQALWLRLLERRAGPGLPRDGLGWLRGQAVREALAARRAADRETPVPRVARRHPEPYEALRTAELVRAVRRALETLPGSCPELLRALSGAPELTYREQAERLGMPRGSLGPVRSRCLGRLRPLVAARWADWSAE